MRCEDKATMLLLIWHRFQTWCKQRLKIQIPCAKHARVKTASGISSRFSYVASNMRPGPPMCDSHASGRKSFRIWFPSRTSPRTFVKERIAVEGCIWGLMRALHISVADVVNSRFIP